MESDERMQGGQTGRVLAGIGIIVIGMLILMDGNGMPVIRLSGHYWPVILIAFGLVRLVDPPERNGRPRSRRSGAWMIYVGVWGLVSELHLFGLSYQTSWPLLVIGAGLGVVWRAMDPQSAGGGRRVREN